MDIQVVLIFILALLTINLLVIGFYVVLVLKEFRETVKRTNIMLDDVSNITSIISSPVASIIGVAAGLLGGGKAVKSVKSLVKDFKEED